MGNIYASTFTEFGYSWLTNPIISDFLPFIPASGGSVHRNVMGFLRTPTREVRYTIGGIAIVDKFVNYEIAWNALAPDQYKRLIDVWLGGSPNQVFWLNYPATVGSAATHSWVYAPCKLVYPAPETPNVQDTAHYARLGMSAHFTQLEYYVAGAAGMPSM